MRKDSNWSEKPARWRTVRKVVVDEFNVLFTKRTWTRTVLLLGLLLASAVADGDTIVLPPRENSAEIYICNYRYTCAHVLLIFNNFCDAILLPWLKSRALCLPTVIAISAFSSSGYVWLGWPSTIELCNTAARFFMFSWICSAFTRALQIRLLFADVIVSYDVTCTRNNLFSLFVFCLGQILCRSHVNTFLHIF